MSDTEARPIDSLIGPSWREHFVAANGVRQHIWRTGGRGPVVVGLPGFQEIGLTWARVARRLESRFDVIMVDFRGQGRTDRGTAAYSQSVLATDVATLLHELTIQRASVIGFSNGAGVAAELAATAPELIRCIVLEDPPLNAGGLTGLGESPQYRAWHTQWMSWLERFRTLPPGDRVREIRSQIPAGGSPWADEELIAFAESYAQLDVELVRDPGPLWAVENRSVVDLLGEIACPVLLLRSARPMPGPPRDTTPTRGRSSPPNVTTVEFDTGHFIRREQFERYIEVVRAFLIDHGDDTARRN